VPRDGRSATDHAARRHELTIHLTLIHFIL
jgi:hypothetical protein